MTGHHWLTDVAAKLLLTLANEDSWFQVPWDSWPYFASNGSYHHTKERGIKYSRIDESEKTWEK
jgi:hypothetical protein